MANLAKHAYGNSENLLKAVENGAVDAYDILFLDGDTDPKIGWIDKNGEVKIVQNGSNQIIHVDELPTANGDTNVIYVYNNECYIWNGNECVTVTNSVDIEEVELAINTKIKEEFDAVEVSAEDIESLFQ